MSRVKQYVCDAESPIVALAPYDLSRLIFSPETIATKLTSEDVRCTFNITVQTN